MQLLVLRWQAAALSAGCGVGCVPCWELGVIRITSAYKTDPQILLHLEQGFWGQMDYFTPNWRTFPLFIRTLAGFRGSRGSRGSRGCKKYNESLTQEKYFFWLIFFCYAFMYCAQHRQTLSFPLYLVWVLGLRSQSRANLEILRFWVRKIFWNLGPRNYSYL